MPTYTNTITSTHQDFTWSGSPSFFNSISLIPGIEYSAQLEVERQFALDRSGFSTIAPFLANPLVSTQDKRQVFIIPNQYVTYNTANKSITGFTLSNYNYTYYLTTDPTQTTPLTILVPNISTSVNTLFTVRRKSISNQSLVTWADGGKLTSSQLNLQTQQLLFLAQETSDRIDTELSNATDVAYNIADGAITYTKILGGGNAWNFAAPLLTISPTSDLHATTRLYTLNSIYNHGVITKDDTAPSSSAVDILETAATAGNSGIWFDPKLGQLKVWAGNAWVALVGVPLSTNNLVDVASTQTITGTKTFNNSTTSTNTTTGAVTVVGGVGIGGALNVGGIISGTGGVVPIGGIIMWSGTIATIPSNWALCNGANSTPDLRDKFIICANSDSSGAKTNVTGSLTQTGGSKDSDLQAHTHASTAAVTNTMSASQSAHNHAITDSGHTHGLKYAALDILTGSGADVKLQTTGTSTFTSNSATTGISLASATPAITLAGSVTVAMTNPSAGSGTGTNANLPPYYALAFIMRTA